jgi:hypothetical protein
MNDTINEATLPPINDENSDVVTEANQATSTEKSTASSQKNKKLNNSPGTLLPKEKGTTKVTPPTKKEAGQDYKNILSAIALQLILFSVLVILSLQYGWLHCYASDGIGESPGSS